nr:e3 ubiquitin-protein ligase tom1-like [Quercus suber]
MDHAQVSDISDLETKCASFRRTPADDEVTSHHQPIQLNVRRERVLSDSFKALYYRDDEAMKYSKIEVYFTGDPKTDCTNDTTAEWFTELTRQICHPDYALFKTTARGSSHPNSLSDIQSSQHFLFFRWFGKIVAKALFEGWKMNVNFSTAMCQQILGRPITLSSLEDVNPESYRALTLLSQNEISSDSERLYFSLTVERFDVLNEIELLDQGRDIVVDEENKQLYIELVTRWHLFDSVEEQIESFLEGFRKVLSTELGSLFTEQEFEELVSGRKW